MSDSGPVFAADEFSLTIVQREADAAYLQFEGNCASAEFLSQTDDLLAAINAAGAQALFIDADRLDHVNSRFIGVLVALIAAEYRLGLKTPGKFLRDLLDMVGIYPAFAVHDDFETFADTSAAE